MSCPERDRIILAFAIAMNEGNNASSELEEASSEDQRAQALHMIQSARMHSQCLRLAVLDHCKVHGC